MLGAIIGDTVGSAYEFHNTKEYNFKLFLSESSYTDDSVMTMAVAYWLLSDPNHTYRKLEDAMVEFAGRYPCPMGDYGTGFHYWLFSPRQLRPLDDRYGASPYESRTGRHPYGSYGNGSAMRVSAVGWFFDTLEETERVAAISAAITHNHPEGIKGAQATAAAIFLARTGRTKEEIRDYIEKTYGYDLHKTWAYWHPIYGWEDSCQGTVPQAIIAFLDSADFEDAIRKAVSLGGDSDTLACITGGIAEAFYKEIPKAMAEKVQNLLPGEFVRVLASVREKTAYGTTCKISE
jgi:ADP-ribosylglycohydrolase